MTKKAKNIEIFIFGLIFNFSFLTFNSFSQDFHFSQYESSPQYLNPSMTGMFDGDYRVITQFRSQWTAIVSKPFTNSALSFDMPMKNNIKAGAFILNNRAGAGNYNALTFVLSGAYDLSIKNSPHHIAGGLQAGIIHKSVDINKLYFESQYSNSNGGGFNTSLPSNETIAGQSILLPEINVGLLYYFSKADSRINPFLGGAAFHLTEPKETFYSADNKLPRRYVVHGGAKINISTKLQMTLHFLGMQQTNDREIVTSITGTYYLKGPEAFLLYGLNYRNKDAAIVHLGLKYGKLIYRISYDYNTSTLNAISNGRGGVELSIVYMMKQKVPDPVAPCPRL
ncbi:MAG: hypothetical protein COA57_10810 [Flavobacteriales bacterium]|nr:MAG: hypothetical protein COA57_10810 [Flavobacteriales bacterium]